VSLKSTDKCFRCGCDIHWCVCQKMNLQVVGKELTSRLSLLESERDKWKGLAEAVRNGHSNLCQAYSDLLKERDRLKVENEILLEEDRQWDKHSLIEVVKQRDRYRKALEEIVGVSKSGVDPRRYSSYEVIFKIARAALEASQGDEK